LAPGVFNPARYVHGPAPCAGPDPLPCYTFLVRLRTAHIVLISAAIFLGVVLIAYGFYQAFARDDRNALALAAAGLSVGCGLAVYLRYFVRKPSTSPASVDRGSRPGP
jgi:hypothetical protein